MQVVTARSLSLVSAKVARSRAKYLSVPEMTPEYNDLYQDTKESGMDWLREKRNEVRSCSWTVGWTILKSWSLYVGFACEKFLISRVQHEFHGSDSSSSLPSQSPSIPLVPYLRTLPPSTSLSWFLFPPYLNRIFPRFGRNFFDRIPKFADTYSDGIERLHLIKSVGNVSSAKCITASARDIPFGSAIVTQIGSWE